MDISETGLRIRSKEALPVGQYVQMQIDALGMRGPASVRSSRHASLRHEIGLEFSNGLRWKKPVAVNDPIIGQSPGGESSASRI